MKILSEKILLNSIYSLKFVNYSNKLTEVARNFRGFISSNSYVVDKINPEYKGNIKIITISEWKDKECWENWYNSGERQKISNEFNNLKRKEAFQRLFKKSINDTFLL